MPAAEPAGTPLGTIIYAGEQIPADVVEVTDRDFSPQNDDNSTWRRHGEHWDLVMWGGCNQTDGPVRFGDDLLGAFGPLTVTQVRPPGAVPGPPAARSGVYVGQPGWMLLNQAATFLHQAYDEVPYLVGSATLSRQWRDIDVRVILDDAEFWRRFPNGGQRERDPWWSLVCSGTSMWLAQCTGLPVDFQVQSMTHANGLYGNRMRVALGLYPILPAVRDAG